MAGPDCVLEALVAILLVNVSLSVLDLHVASLAAFPSVEVPATKMNQLGSMIGSKSTVQTVHVEEDSRQCIYSVQCFQLCTKACSYMYKQSSD